MPPPRLGFLLLTFVALATNSCAQREAEEKICREQRTQCEVDTGIRDVTAMLGSCQKCYLTCQPLVQKWRDEWQVRSEYCINMCAHPVECFVGDAAKNVQVTDEYRCKVSDRWCWSDDNKNHTVAQVRKSCGLCAKACNYPYVRKQRNDCEDQCSKRSLSCAVRPRANEAERCRTYRARCERDAKANNASAMRDSCQNCYLACGPPYGKETTHETLAESNFCLDTCAKNDCLDEKTANGAQVADQFRCNVNLRRCQRDDRDNGQRNDLVRKSCGTCAEACNFPFTRNQRAYCENRCSIRNFSCAPDNATTNLASPPPKQNETNPPTVGKPGNPSENVAPAPGTKDSNGKQNSDQNNGPWHILGPVLGALATLIAPTFTAICVWACRRAKPAPPEIKYPPPNPVDQGYDEGWPNTDNTTGVAGLYEQAVQQPEPRWSKFFPCWR